MEIGEHCSVLEYNMDRITETDQGIIRTIEVIFEKEILEGICGQIRMIEVKIIEVDTEKIIGMIIMKEVGLGLGIDGTLIILEGMIEVIVCLDQVQEQVAKEIEVDAINVGNMIILLRMVQLQKWKRKQNKLYKCTIWMKNKPH